MSDYIDLADKVTALQNLLVSRATGQGADEHAYVPLRAELPKDPLVGSLLPRFVRTSRDLGQFWLFIQPKFPSYGERREFIWEEFRPALAAAETGTSPVADTASEALTRLSSDAVQGAWRRALARHQQRRVI